jgi:hypothetical protein
MVDIGNGSNVLGPWYANLVYFGRVQLVMATNERSLLTVFVPARDIGDVDQRLRDAIARLLWNIKVPEDCVRGELAEMSGVMYTRTESRKVLGVMNDFVHQTDWMFYENPACSLDDVGIYLADTVTSAIEHGGPRDVALRMLTSRRAT